MAMLQKTMQVKKVSVIHYRGLVQGPANSSVDVIHALTATVGTSRYLLEMTTTRFRLAASLQNLAGKKTIKSEGIPIFVIPTKDKAESASTRK